MEPTENEKSEIRARATEIDTGALPLSLGSVPMMSSLSLDPSRPFHGNATAPQWNYSELLSQRKLVGTFPITTSSADGHVVWSFRHTFANVIEMHMRTLKNLFHLYSWKLHFSFQFRSNFQQVGQILIVQHHIPRNLFKFLTSYDRLEDSYQLCTMLPHVKVAMGEDVDVEAEMVWNAPVSGSFGYANGYEMKSWSMGYGGYDDARDIEYSSYDMGSIAVIVGKQMEVALSVNPQMTVRIWSYLSDLKYGAYCPEDHLV